MTKQTEALKLALEALEEWAWTAHPRPKTLAAITAIKEALAQDEQEPCGGCGGSGWVPRDPDIGTEQECFDCNGSGAHPNQPEQEPVAYFDWLPEEATHIAQIKVKTRSGGRLEMGAYVFKYDNEVLMVYTTDNDNEYPGWREAKQCFYHLNFPVFPIPTTPPKRPWVELTDEEISQLWISTSPYFNEDDFAKAVEAKLKELNT